MNSKEALLAMGDRRCELIAEKAVRLELVEAEETQIFDFLVFLRVSNGLSVETLRDYSDSIMAFFIWYRQFQKPLDDVTLEILEEFQKYLFLVCNYAPATQAGATSAIKRFFSWRSRYSGRPDPSTNLIRPRIPSRTPKKYQPNELKSVFASIDSESDIGIRNTAILTFFLATGSRITESAVDLSQMVLRQRTGTVQFFGKGAKERLVSFEGLAVESLQRWLAVRDSIVSSGDTSLWLSLHGPTRGRGLSVAGIDRCLDGLFVRAGVTWKGPHRLRSTFATSLYDSGIDIERVRRLLGHRDINTTQRYLAVAEKTLSTRLPASALASLTGISDSKTPRWIQEKLQAKNT